MQPIKERLIALAVVGLVLFNYPLLDAFAIDGRLLGVPVLYVYLFGVWAMLIALIAASLRRGPRA